MSVRQTVGIYTLGCKVNQYESQAIAERCEALGILVLPPEEICDAYIINTCTVTGEADRKAREKGEPAPSDVDALVNELGLDQTPAAEPEEEMVNEPVTDGAELGAPGGDVVGGSEVPIPPGVVEGEPGGAPGVV